jgi:putative membrane protein
MTTVWTAPEIGWRRLSPRMLLVHPVVEVGKALPAIVAALLAGHGTTGGTVWAAAITAIVAVLSIVRWFTTRFRITDKQIELHHGLFRRRTLTAPLDRVRTVDVTSHLLHRLLGLARVVIGTGTSDRKGRDRVILDGLTLPEATGLRGELLHRRPAPLPTEPELPVGVRHDVEELLVRADPRWLRFAPFTLTGAVTGLALLGVVWRIVDEAHVNLDSLSLVRDVSHRLERWSLALAIAVVAAAVIAFVVIASTVGYVLAFWRFRVTRHTGGTLHVTRGLITTRATSIEQRRLRGAEVCEPLLLRSVRGARCLAITTGLRVGRGAERGGEILLPPAPRAAAISLAATVIGTDVPFTATLGRHPIAARRRRVTRALAVPVVLVVIAAVGVAFGHWPAWFLVAAAVLAGAAVPLGIDRYYSLGHSLAGGYLVIRYGSIVRRHTALQTEGVIGWNIRRSYFQRRVGLASLTATTAAGRQGYKITDISEAEVVAFADATVPNLLTEFLAQRQPRSQAGRSLSVRRRR